MLPHPPPLHNPHNPHSPSQTHPQLDFSDSASPFKYTPALISTPALSSGFSFAPSSYLPPILVRSTFHAKFRFYYSIILNHYFAFLRNDAVPRAPTSASPLRNTNFYFPPVWINSNFMFTTLPHEVRAAAVDSRG
uniref:Uncharacterized protein n=1 Tax=Fagus sylvatica TaxID=28930 RepID=A0A2N9ED19_FAGSY